ncbi:hypothetical protein [Kribbella sp. NBC_00889]|uniref:hypothetical protein n=1 Tax=Kribbella sp. NBC_00889 TaxID=2975974 RepID=UPI00386D153E|nr:hypothetical protein OG817_26130 [Kribbella sp. NBC_00889]
MPAALALWTPAPTGAAPWVVFAILLSAAVIAGSARLVPTGHWLVVVRSGRVVRVAASGLTFHIVGLERQVLLARGPIRMPLVVCGRSTEGAEVRLLAEATFRIVDPALAARSSLEPLQLAADEAERTLGGLIRRSGLASLAVLPTYDHDLEQTLITGRGVRLTALRIDRIDFELTACVLRAAGHQVK